ncbi:MAG: tRNA pseudouridine(55) synthase TruB [Verrucomicrobia bacterium]|jgi:tRNA pseudouridine55 synthase|nr:tRNA pseudouridine(55) synthase TruB [Verrucomicrobiota bacterium]MBT7065375.1 tRNA pseudouridine(55) synthase TruB [Verrucomicrobiota bacterium]MBT7701319.1 tRNA pseudouridine(55) synthase TruB [Verrucomicrobiota bacterium]
MTTPNFKTPSQRYKTPAPPREPSALDGILLVDKPAGPTSHDIVHAIRKHFAIRKVGHGGTLDPQATGLLVLLLGKGTKLSSYFMTGDKGYDGTMTLGAETNTQDADGEVTREGDYSGVTREQAVAAMKHYVGDMMQTPPMVSAVKVKGVPLYKSARKGQTIEREARLIHIYRFDVTAFDLPEISFHVDCTKGTYVRTLSADVGADLECGAHLSALRRTASGQLSLEDATPFDTIMEMDEAALKKIVLPLARFASTAPRP